MRWSASQVLAWIIRKKPLSLEEDEWTRAMGRRLKDAQRKLAGALSSGCTHTAENNLMGLLNRCQTTRFASEAWQTIVRDDARNGAAPHEDRGRDGPRLPLRLPRLSFAKKTEAR